jgi:hypothetical protein
MNQDLAFAKELAKYKDQWVALKDKRVIAAGKSVREVLEKVARKKIKDFAFHYVPLKRLAIGVHLWPGMVV